MGRRGIGRHECSLGMMGLNRQERGAWEGG